MKKGLKRILACFLSVMMATTVLSSFSLTAGAAEIQSESTGNSLRSWGDITEDGFIYGEIYNLETENYDSVRIIGYEGSAVNVVIPEKINNLEVTEIAYKAFADNETMRSLTMPDTITFVDDYAFEGCTNLESIKFSKNIEDIDKYAVINTKWYQNQLQTEAVVYIGKVAVSAGEKLPEKLVIKDGTVAIGYGAFEYKYSLKSVTFPASVKEIGAWSFCGCDELSEVIIKSNDVLVKNYAFYNTKWLETRPDGPLYIGATFYKYVGENCPNNFTVKSGTKLISGAAFMDCTALVNINLPESLVEIESSAFENCSALEYIKIPAGVKELGYETFTDCVNLKSVVCPLGVDFYSGDFDGVEDCRLYVYNEDGKLFFKDYYGMSSYLTVPSEVKGEKVYGVAGSACYGNESLTSVTLPSDIEVIENNAFTYCENLEEVILPDKFVKINYGAFEETPFLEKLLSQNGPIYLCRNLIGYGGDMPANTTIKVKDGTVCISSAALVMQKNLVGVTLPSSIRFIGDYAFEVSGLKNITLPNGLEKIGNSAFRDCKITEIALPDSVKNYGYGAFADCNELIKVVMPAKNSATELLYTFGGCPNLKNIDIPEGVETLDTTFIGCTALKSVKLPQSLKTIGMCTFDGCSALESLNVPAGVTTIHDNVFDGCASLHSITVSPDNKNYCAKDNTLYTKDMKTLMFCGNNSHSTFTVPDSVKNVNALSFNSSSFESVDLGKAEKIGYRAFADSSIQNIDIPDSVTEIAYMSFIDCKSLSYVGIPKSIKAIEGDTFTDCESLKSINIPAEVERIDENALGKYIEVTIHKDYYENGNTGEKTEYEWKSYETKNYENFTIFGYKDTEAQRYAKDNEFKFVDISDSKNAHTDPQTRIKVSAKADAELKAVRIADTSKLESKIKNGKITNAFDISLVKNGKEVAPDGYAEVRIPCTNSKAKVYRLEKDGSVTDMKAGYDDGMLVFYTEHFSEYAVVEMDNRLMGDVDLDGILKINDATLIQRYLTELATMNSEQLARFDINGDGKNDIGDATYIQRVIAEII